MLGVNEGLEDGYTCVTGKRWQTSSKVDSSDFFLILVLKGLIEISLVSIGYHGVATADVEERVLQTIGSAPQTTSGSHRETNLSKVRGVTTIQVKIHQVGFRIECP